MNLKFLFLALCFTFFACREKTNPENLEIRKHEIILINIYGERCEMSKLLDLVSKENPKIIGINFLYTEEKEGECDTLLQQSLKRSKKVILVDGFRDGREVYSHDKFIDASLLSAPARYAGYEDNSVDSYFKLISLENGRSKYTFPFEIAAQYDTTKSFYLASLARLDDHLPINFRYQLTDFKVLNGISDVERNGKLLKDKIVIIGVLGSSEEDLFYTPSNPYSKNTHGTLMLANITLNILEDLDNPEAEDFAVNKYTEHIWKSRHKKDQ